MKLKVLQSAKQENTIYAQLPSCVGFFSNKSLRSLVVGESYDFIIVGYSNKLNPKTGLPSAVFLELALPTDKLITECALERAGSDCSDGINSGSVSTYNEQLGEIYAGRSTPVPTVDNFNIGELPEFPTLEVNMWVRQLKGIWHAIGVDRYEDIQPCFDQLPEIKRVAEFREQIKLLRERYNAVANKPIEGVTLAQAKKNLRNKFNFSLVPTRSNPSFAYKMV